VLRRTAAASLRVLTRRLRREIVDDSVPDTAAQLAFYFMLSLFPFLFFLVTLSAYLPLQGTLEMVVERLRYVMPGAALEVVEGHLNWLVGNPRPRLLTLGLVVTLWTASRGVNALRKGLNLAYDVPESRPIWRTQGVAIGMTMAGSVLTLIAVAAFVLGGNLGFWIAERVDFGGPFLVVWSWLRWPFTALAVMLVAALCYYLLPDVRQRFRYITPGSVTFTALWLLSTWGFTQYVEHFGRFSVTYGSIGGVMVLMIWLYLTGLVMLLGGELNAALEHLSAEGKQKGARAEGEAPLPQEVRPSANPPAAASRASSAQRGWLRRWRERRRPPVMPPPGPEHPR
jgi:membrane protein